MVYVYDWHGNHDRFLGGLVSHCKAQGHDVDTLRGNSPNDMFRFIADVNAREVAAVFIWNGSEPGCDVVKAVCESARVPWCIVEVGWFDRMHHIHFDRLGINAASSLMTDSLDWVGETAPVIEESRRRFAGGQGYTTREDGCVFVPLQLDVDTNIYRNSPFPTMARFIRHVMTVFPKDEVVIKVHPQDRSTYADRLPGNVRIVRDGSVYDWAMKARLVYGINSNSLLESALVGCPTVAVGRGLFSAHAHQIDRLIAAAVKLQVPTSEINLTHLLRRAGINLSRRE